MDEDYPEVYTDGVEFQFSPYTVTLSFTMAPVGRGATAPPERVANVRMSLEHAKILAILMRKNLKGVEDQLGAQIVLPSAVYQQLGISPQEDWG
jgi:Protein of unknown function (DUF3467).